MNHSYDVIVLGGGPAGLTAAIYLARSRLKTLVIDRGTIGGQTVLSYAVANYPGVEETSGQAISQTMLKQARHFGAEVLAHADVRRIELGGDTKRVEVDDEGVFEAPALILAPGGTSRKLGVPGEEQFEGRGISYCATCDGDFFTGKEIVVVGGGNSALEEAVSLTRYATKVTVLHLLDQFQAQPWAVAQAEANPRIRLITKHRILRFEGQESLSRVVAEDLNTGQELSIDAAGTFIFIGYRPNTDEIPKEVKRNAAGEILADENMATSVPGVYVAGDARQKRHRQITTAVADGTIAAISAADFVANQKERPSVPKPSRHAIKDSPRIAERSLMQ